LLIAAMVVLSVLSCLGGTAEAGTQARAGGRAYTPHAPLWLSGTFSINESLGITGGTGSKEDPFVVSGWDITSTDQTGIDIVTNEDCLKIVNCRIHGIPAGFWAISTSGCDAAVTIQDCVFEDNAQGIKLGSLRGGGDLEACTFSNDRESVRLEGSSCGVRNSTFTGGDIGINCSDEGRSLYHNSFSGVSTAIRLGPAAKSCHLFDNTIQDGQTGISVEGVINPLPTLDGKGGIISNNTISGASTGLSLKDGTTNEYIHSNLIMDAETGAAIIGSNSNNVRANIFEGCSRLALSVTGSETNHIALNNFIGNAGGGTQASSNRAGNEWYDDYTGDVWWTDKKVKQGNFWSDKTGPDLDRDGFVDTPYTISGGLEKDNYDFVMKVPWVGLYGKPISARAVASQASGAAPMGVDFVPNITDSKPNDTTFYNWDMPYTFSWDFGDSGTSTSAMPSHTYNSPGTYQVVLTVTTSQGATAQSPPFAITVTGGGGNPLTASVTADRTGGDVPLAVAFTGTASGGTPPYTYSWNFGDGGTGTGATASHTFTAAGTYSVLLTVTDSASATKTASALSVAATGGGAGNPLAVASAADKTGGAPPLTITFSGSASGGKAPYSYNWSFGDGGSGTGAAATHSYTANGTYTAILTVTDSNGISKTATAITVKIGGGGGGNPLVVAATGAPAKGKAPLSVVFVSSVSSGTGPYTFSWDFKDGQVSDQQSPTHTFNKTGTYLVALKVTDAKSAVKTATVSVSVTGGSTDINTKKGFLPGFEALLLVAAVALGLVMLRKRRA